MLELQPAAQQLAMLVDGVADNQLTARTPCPRYSLGDLLDHVNGLSLAFAFAARKEPIPDGTGAPGDSRRLADNWRERIPAQLEALAAAWRDPAAWQGMTTVAGLDLPGEVAGVIALNEVLVHGWDVSRASGQPYAIDDHLVDACIRFVSTTVDNRDADGRLFGPVVQVPDEATALERLIGLSGRDPNWVA